MAEPSWAWLDLGTMRKIVNEYKDLDRQRQKLEVDIWWSNLTWQLYQRYRPQGMAELPGQRLGDANARAEAARKNQELQNIQGQMQSMIAQHDWLLDALNYDINEVVRAWQVREMARRPGEAEQIIQEAARALEAFYSRQPTGGEAPITGAPTTEIPTGVETIPELGESQALDQYLAEMFALNAPQLPAETQLMSPEMLETYARHYAGIEPLGLAEATQYMPLSARQSAIEQYYAERGLPSPWPATTTTQRGPQYRLTQPSVQQPYQPTQPGEVWGQQTVTRPGIATEEQLMTWAEQQARREFEADEAYRQAVLEMQRRQLAQDLQVEQMRLAQQRAQMGADIGTSVASLASQNWATGMPYALPRGTTVAPGSQYGGPLENLARMSGRSTYTPFQIAPYNPPSQGDLMSIIERAVSRFS